MRRYLVEVRFSDGTVHEFHGIFPSDGAAILAGLGLPGDLHRAVVPHREAA